MEATQPVRRPIEFLPIGPDLYRVGKVTADIIIRHREQTRVLADSQGKPVTGEIALAYAAIVRALVSDAPPRLTDEYIGVWLSPALCTIIGQEWLRQFLEVSKDPGQVERAVEAGIAGRA